MPKHNTHVSSENRGCHSPLRSDNKQSVHLSDLVELVMEPLAAQIDHARLEILGRIQALDMSVGKAAAEILKKVQAVDDSAEILAAQKARDLKEVAGKKKNG